MAATGDGNDATPVNASVSPDESETRNSQSNLTDGPNNVQIKDKSDNNNHVQQPLLTKDEVVNANSPLKIVVVGDGTVGKTCMCIAYTQGVFLDSEYVPTVFENYTGTQDYRGSNYQLALWDTAGQEDYERLRPLSYPGTNVFLLCFSIANLNSYQNIISKWYPEIKEHAPRVPFILVGTKSDLRPANQATTPWYRSKCIDSLTSQRNGSEETFITTTMGRKLAKKLNASSYVECSAKSLSGIKDVILEAIKAGIGDVDKKSRCLII